MFFSYTTIVSIFLVLMSQVSSFSIERPNTRRQWLHDCLVVASSVSGTIAASTLVPKSAEAAPPIAVIAEELGYFPVQNREGQLMYVPKKIQRKSTDQAIKLAKLMKEKGVSMYGAYWCPHCSRQKELFGKEAWSYVSYVECAPKGYGFEGMCKNVDGYPSFKGKRGRVDFSGERPLEYIAQEIGYKGFDPSLEDTVPMIGTACKLPGR